MYSTHLISLPLLTLPMEPGGKLICDYCLLTTEIRMRNAERNTDIRYSTVPAIESISISLSNRIVNDLHLVEDTERHFVLASLDD